MERPSPSYTVKIGETLTVSAYGEKRGIGIFVEKNLRRHTKPGSTALHEAAHIEAAQAAGGIQKATIIASSDYLGATWPVVMTAMAAMAAKADGHSGYGWDEFMTKFILGVDPDSAASSAAAYLASRQDYLHAVASVLQEKGEIGQADVDIAHAEVDEKRRGIWETRIRIEDADGNVKEYHEKSVDGKVMIPGEWIILPKKEEKKEKEEKEEEGNIVRTT